MSETIAPSTTAAAPQETPAPAQTAQPVTPPTAAHSHAGLSETEHAAMVGWARQDVASGKLSPEAATKLFDDLGVPADERTLPPIYGTMSSASLTSSSR